jgi:hypothetical protein
MRGALHPSSPSNMPELNDNVRTQKDAGFHCALEGNMGYPRSGERERRWWEEMEKMVGWACKSILGLWKTFWCFPWAQSLLPLPSTLL